MIARDLLINKINIPKYSVFEIDNASQEEKSGTGRPDGGKPAWKGFVRAAWAGRRRRSVRFPFRISGSNPLKQDDIRRYEIHQVRNQSW